MSEDQNELREADQETYAAATASDTESGTPTEQVDSDTQAEAEIDGEAENTPIPNAPATAPQRYTITVDARDRVFYALAYNKVPTVRTITVRNDSGPSTGQLTITAEMRWTATDLQPMSRTEVVVDTPASGDSIVIKGDSFRLSDAALVDLMEEAPADLIVTVTDSEGSTSSVTLDVRVFARNQWLASPDIASITAAFVQPNHPAVTEILRDAGAILLRRTGSSALQGYQHDDERVKQIAQAVFESLQQRIDRYINPPASFAEEGQKLRPLDEVLEQRQGTCLDLACAYASCLEQVGLHPWVFIVHGHAFTGVLVKELGGLQPSVVSTFETLVARIDSGDVLGVEATCLPNGSSFEHATAAVREHFTERALDCEICSHLVAAGEQASTYPHLLWAVDVYRAHREGVLPLPARVVRDGIVTLVIDNGPSQPPVVERRDERTHKLLPNTVPARVQQWKNSLLDLSFRNPLLNFRPDRTGLPLVTASKVLHDVEDRLISGEAVNLVPADQLSAILRERGFRAAMNLGEEELISYWNTDRVVFAALDAGPFDTRVRNLRSKAKTDEQDTGANNLYLTLGSLKWNDPRSTVTEVRSPIFLVPIRIITKRGSKAVTIVADETATTGINYCLIEALRSRRGLKLEWFSEDMSDDSGLDVQRGFQEIRKELLSEHLTEQGFEVIEDLSIGLLRYSKVRLWQDLNDHWEQFTRNPIVKHLVEGRRGQRFEDPQDPDGVGAGSFSDADLLNPQPADGAQSRAITRALAQHSFVLEGPPGTGKSQTITNLLANALAKGKRVLFVAEKQAALSVVKERLTEVGLNPFCLDLHDKGSSPADIKQQLREALEFTPDANMNQWLTNQERFDSAARFLAAYRDKLHGGNAGGTSYYDAYARLLELGDGPTATVTRRLFQVDADTITTWRRMLADIESFTEPAKPQPGHPWALAGRTTLTDIDRAALAESIKRVDASLHALQTANDSWGPIATSAQSFDEIDGVIAVMSAATLAACPSRDHWRAVLSADWAGFKLRALDELAATLSSVADLIGVLGTDFLLRDDSAVLAALTEAADSFVLGRKGRVRTALGALATTPVFANADPTAALAQLNRMVAAAKAIATNSAQLHAAPGLAAPAGWQPTTIEAIEDFRTRVSLALRAVQFLATETDIAARAATAAAAVIPPSAEQIDRVTGLIGGIRAVGAAVQVSDESSRRWLNGRPLVSAVAESLPTWRADVDAGTWVRLTRWLALADAVAVLDDESVAQFREELLDGRLHGSAALAAFDRALMDVTLTVVGEEMALDTFEHSAHNRRVADFIALLRERETLLRSVIPHMLHSGRSFNAASQAGQVGALRTELSSKRRGARSVRHLVAKYPELIASLTPCFLMSPDSIAKFIEPGTLRFDLVVFDEASQIPVASAIGALGRAAAAIVVGDSRQMPPTSVGVAGSGAQDDDALVSSDDEAVITDAESILDECLDSGLEQEWLAWHYRSKDELLIKFSNDKYYDGRLSSFPSPWQQVPKCGISYQRVNGQFDHGGKRTNAIEADAVVAEVRRRANDPELRGYSIGVVTLNLEQRDLIQQKLLELNDRAVTALLESDDDAENLFVLNLESVQGRERDVILLGTGFSARVGGGKMPLQFGPITAKGGERRLNVAVTRARREVMVFSSFDPEALAEANSLGMTHLYEYLKMARAASAGVRPESNVPSSQSDDLHRNDVAKALRDRGLIVEAGVGLSSFKVDLAVTLPGFEHRRLVGVLLDGKVWASRALVLDRDALPATVLRNMMGWPRIARVWLPSWRHDPSEIVEDIYDAAIAVSMEPETATPAPIEELATIVIDETPAQTTDLSTAPVISAAPVNAAPSNERPFSPLPTFGQIGILAELEAGSPKARDLLARIADEYGPISLTIAIKATANAFGLGTVRDKRVAEFSRLANPETVISTDFGDFLFPRELVEHGKVVPTFDWYRLSRYQDRPVTDISPHEMANLLLGLVRSSFGMQRDELATEALSKLGYGRKGVDTVAHVQQVIDWAVEREYFTDNDGYITT